MICVGVFVASLVCGVSSAAAADPNAISYAYDELGRLVLVLDPTAAANGVARYTYDAVGNMTQVERLPSSGVSVLMASPSRAVAGQSILVYGTGFSATPSQDVVAINGAVAVVTAATRTQLQVVVPTNGSTGPLAVSTPAGFASSASPLVVVSTAIPIVGGVSATIVDPGASIVVTGSGFAPAIADNVVAIGQVRGQVTAASATSLTVTVPPGATPGRLTVATPDGVSAGGPDVWVGPRPIKVSVLPPVIPAASISQTTRTTIGAAASVLTVPSSTTYSLLSFDGSSGQRVFVNFTGGTAGAAWTASLLDPFGVEVAFASSGVTGNVDTLRLPTNGTYTLVVSTTRRAGGSLTAAVSQVVDPIGSIVADGSSTVASLSAPGQVAHLTFTATAGQRVFLRAQAAGISTANVVLRNASGFQIGSVLASAAASFIDTTTLPAAGVYTIDVDPYNAAVGSVTVNLFTVPTDVSGTVSAGAAGQTPVSLPLATGQNARYTLAGTAGQRVFVKLQGPASGTGPSSVQVTLLGTAGSALASALGTIASATNALYLDTVTLPVDGTYTIVIDPLQDKTGGARLYVYSVPADLAGTVTPAGVTQTPLALAITTPGQNAAYSFSGAAGQRISVKIAGPATGAALSSSQVSLVNGAGTVLGSVLATLSSSTSSGFLDSVTLPSTAPYTVRVDPVQDATGSARLSTYLVPADLAGGVTVGGPAVTPVTATPGQNAAYTFTGGNQQGVQVAMSASSYTVNGLTLRIRRVSTGTVVASKVSTAAATTLSATLPAADSYTLELDPLSSGTGQATLALTQTSPGMAMIHAASRPPSTTPQPGLRPSVPSVGPAPLPWQPTSPERWTPPNKEPSTWFAHRDPSPYDKAPLLAAVPGETAIAGRVLRLNGLPLIGATITDGNGARTTTDGWGRFLLRRIHPGRVVVTVDGASANHGSTHYGRYEIGIDARAFATTPLDSTVWSPVLDVAHDVALHYPLRHDVVLTTPYIVGLSVRIPAGSEVRDRNGHLITHLGITPVPLDRAPFPMPGQFPVYFTVQPGAVTVWPHGVEIVYPNKLHAAPGSRVTFYSYQPRAHGWHTYGAGTVTADGTRVVFDHGTRPYEITSAGICLGCVVVAPEIPPLLILTCFAIGPCPHPADPIDAKTGEYTDRHDDLVEPGSPTETVSRFYRSSVTANGTGHLGYGWRLGSDLRIIQATDGYFGSADLSFPSGETIHYTRISPGTGYSDMILAPTNTAGAFAGSRLTWNGYGWELTLRDGAVYGFLNGGMLVATRDRFGNQITYNHVNGTGRLSETLSSSGRWITYTYNASGTIASAQDQAGRVVSYTYDALGRLATVTNAAGGQIVYTYDGSRRITGVRDARQISYVTNHYDANGRVDVQSVAGEGDYHFAYATDSNGLVTQTDMTNPRGYTTRYTFSGADTTRVTAALGTPHQRVTSYEFSPTHQVTAVVDALNRRTTYAYDSSGNLTTATPLAGAPLERTWSATYDSASRLTSTSDPLAHGATYTYNAQGSLTAVADPRGKVWNITQDGTGHITSVTDPLTNTTSATVVLGATTKVTDPLGYATQRFVDQRGLITQRTDAVGAASKATYNAGGALLTIAPAANTSITVGRDANGNPTSLTDERGNTRGTTYDTADRPTSATDPLNHGTNITYDADGNVASTTDANEIIADGTYDELDRLVTIGHDRTGTPQNPTYQSTATITYDLADRPIQIVDTQNGTVTLTWDDRDEVTAVTTPTGTVAYTYDTAGRRATMTAANAATATYSYDAANNVTGVARAGTAAAITYDNANRVSTITLPDSVVETFAYDQASNVASATYSRAGATLGTLQYTSDPRGLTTSVGGTYARTSLPSAATSNFDAADRITTRNGQPYTWDNAGRLLSDGARSFTWNDRDQLLSAATSAGTTTYGYDALGARTSVSQGTTTTRYLNDGAQPALELNQAGTTTATLLAGPGLDEVFATTDSTNQTASLLTDPLGSTIATADAAGTTQTSFTYDPHGKASTAGAAPASAYAFTQRPVDATGLQYNRDRYYDPTLGTFISTDPLGLAGGSTNLYQYAFNNPITNNDPTGDLATFGGGFGFYSFGGTLGRKAGGGSPPLTPPDDPGGMPNTPGGGGGDGGGGGGGGGGPLYPPTAPPLIPPFDPSFPWSPFPADPGGGVSASQAGGDDLTANAGKAAARLGLPLKQVLDAVHGLKPGSLSRGGEKRNPDVLIDTRTGDIYAPGGEEVIGNVFDDNQGGR